MNTGCRGFTLIEISLLLVVVGILLIISMPNQTDSLNHNNKALAKAFLLKVSVFQASYFLQNKEYALNFKSLGLSPSLALKEHYKLQLNKVSEPSGLVGYSIKAMPKKVVESQPLWINYLGQTSANWDD